MNRRAFAAVTVAALLAGCKDPETADKSGASNFVIAGDDVAVKSVRIYPDSGSAVQGDTIYVVTFTFTNKQGLDLVPQLNHFVLEDQQKIRHAALDGGAEQLAGIVNDTSMIKRGDTRDFTLGFQVYHDTVGTLFYDPT